MDGVDLLRRRLHVHRKWRVLLAGERERERERKRTGQQKRVGRLGLTYNTIARVRFLGEERTQAPLLPFAGSVCDGVSRLARLVMMRAHPQLADRHPWRSES